MDVQMMYVWLADTLSPIQEKRTAAEQQLGQLEKASDFASNLLLIVCSHQVAEEIRHAGSVFFKNHIRKYWDASREEKREFEISQDSRNLIKTNILDAIVHAPNLLRSQLLAAMGYMVYVDYPDQWADLLEKCINYLKSNDTKIIYPTLLALYEVARRYELTDAENPEQRARVLDVILPLMLQLANHMLNNDSHDAGALVKVVFKIYYQTTNMELAKELRDKNVFEGWLKAFLYVLEKEIPEKELGNDREMWHKFPWWQAKKWAAQILLRFTERYCSSSAEEEYKEFKRYYIGDLGATLLQSLLKQLDLVRNGKYVSPRVLHVSLSQLTQLMSHAHTWNMLKGHVITIIKDIIFPLLCFNNEDQELWEREPYEFVHRKFDVLEDFKSPISAAQELLQEAVLVRKKALLMPILEFCMMILVEYSQQTTVDMSLARKKDGAMALIGYISESLDKQKNLRSQLDDMLLMYVLPDLKSSFPFLRARACWVVQTFSFVTFKNPEHFKYALEAVIHCIRDSELPVQVHAAMALQDLIAEHNESHDLVKPFVAAIVEDLLKLTNDTDFEEMAGVVQELISNFSGELRPLAVQICTQLRDNFMRLQREEAANAEEASQHKAFTAYGVLCAILTLVDALSDAPPLLAEVSVILAPMIAYVLQTAALDLYDEILQIVTMLTFHARAIHPSIWPLLPIMHETFKRDAFVYFDGKISPYFTLIRWEGSKNQSYSF